MMERRRFAAGDVVMARGEVDQSLYVVASGSVEVEPASPADVVVTIEEDDDARYRKLVLSNGRAVGAILIGHSRLVPAVQQAIEAQADLSSCLDALRMGDWSVVEHELADSGV